MSDDYVIGDPETEAASRGISATLMERRVPWRADERVEPASQLAKLPPQVDEDPTAIY